jgi:hypothetical protein
MSTVKRTVLVLGITVLGMLAISALHRVEAAGLTEDDFVPLATQGFLRAVDGSHPEGSRRNSYIWSMRWWHDKLYVGTLRDAICLFGAGGGVVTPGYETVCPPPGTFLTPEQRAEIWEYTPGGSAGADGTWQRVFQAPLLLSTLFPTDQLVNLMQLMNGGQPPDAGQFDNILQVIAQLPREFGYRGMTTCDAGGQENLYVANLGIVGGRILYSPDGTTFTAASTLGLDLLNDAGYRALLCWNERLWTSPSGVLEINSFTPPISISLDADIAFNKVLLTNSNPSSPSSPWESIVDVANDPQLGDANNLGIWGLEVFRGALYIGVTNRTTGFEIWRADGASCNRPPGLCELAWEKIIDNGGGLPVPEDPPISTNARIFQFKEFNGYLYFTAAETAFPTFGPAELGRIGPDGRWDLIVGAARDASTMAADPNFNCQRQDDVCLPLSGRGPSFGPDPFTRGSALYFWQLEVHDGFLYLGTAESQGLDSRCVSPVAGFDLWRSPNGIDWSQVFDDGLGNPCNYGARNMASTPLGLFLGTANPFTIEDGTGPSGGTGGAEVWLGIGGE